MRIHGTNFAKVKRKKYFLTPNTFSHDDISHVLLDVVGDTENNNNFFINFGFSDKAFCERGRAATFVPVENDAGKTSDT